MPASMVLVFTDDPEGIRRAKKDIENQTRQAVKNLENVLSSSGLSLSNIVKTTIFLVNMADLVKVNEIYASYFKKNKPARATVGVNSLPKGVLIEIDAVATF